MIVLIKLVKLSNLPSCIIHANSHCLNQNSQPISSNLFALSRFLPVTKLPTRDFGRKLMLAPNVSRVMRGWAVLRILFLLCCVSLYGLVFCILQKRCKLVSQFYSRCRHGVIRDVILAVERVQIKINERIRKVVSSNSHIGLRKTF